MGERETFISGDERFGSVYRVNMIDVVGNLGVLYNNNPSDTPLKMEIKVDMKGGCCYNEDGIEQNE